MDCEKIVLKELNETVTIATHKSGLKIYICEKPEYRTVNALFGTNYGSIDTQYTKEGKTVNIPEGTAHFLEHKLFESEDGGVFQRYAKTGAMANAYTSFDRTCYLFVSTSDYKENLKILLDFVQNPYLTDENVEKEKGIIAQEIKMYDDVASWRVFFNLLTALYQKHPVRIDIAGTVDSIYQIDCQTLKECYSSYYNLSNMFIVIAGNVKTDDVLAIADEMLKDSNPQELKRSTYDEPDEINKNYIEQNLPVANPIFAIGFKESHDTARVNSREIVITDVLLSMIAGGTSPLFNKLLKEGIINDEFSSEYFTGYGYSSIIFSGESTDPQRVFDELKKEITRLKSEGMDKAEFEQTLKKCYGREITSTYDDVEAIASQLVETAVRGSKPFEELEIYRTISYDECMKFLNEKFDFNKAAMSVILPTQE